MAEDALTQLISTRWFKIGRKTAPLYIRNTEWLFRRVESIEFIDRRSVKRTVTIDFEKPRGLPSLKKHAPSETNLVPIAMMQKWPPTMDFHLSDAQGHALSRYKGTTTKRLDFGLLMGVIDSALGDPGEKRSGELDEVLRLELAKIVEERSPSQVEVARVVNKLTRELERLHAESPGAGGTGEEGADLIAVAVDLAARLSSGSILWVAVPGPSAADQVVTFSYLGTHLVKSPAFEEDKDHQKRIENRRPPAQVLWRALATSCSWRGRTLIVPLLHGGRQVRYHLDIHAPPGSVEIHDATALALPNAEDEPNRSKHPNRPKEPESLSVTTLAALYPDLLSIPDEWVGPESNGYFMDYGKPMLLASSSSTNSHRPNQPGDALAEISDRRAHVYFGKAGAPSHRVLLQLKLKGAREGLIQACALAAMVIAVLMVVVYFGLEAAIEHPESAVVLLAVAPVVLGYVVVSPDEQPFEHEHLVGVRVMALIAGSLPIAGALFLVLTHKHTGDPDLDLSVVRTAWKVLAIVSILVALGLIASWLCSAPPKRRREPTAGKRA
jgi:hypothetical protein